MKSNLLYLNQYNLKLRWRHFKMNKKWKDLAYRFSYYRELYKWEKQKKTEDLWVAREEE